MTSGPGSQLSVVVVLVSGHVGSSLSSIVWPFISGVVAHVVPVLWSGWVWHSQL
jgi:hypothetical protein